MLKIKEAASVRQHSSDESEKLLDITEKLPMVVDASSFGYHCWCYQSFKNIARLKRKFESDFH